MIFHPSTCTCTLAQMGDTELRQLGIVHAHSPVYSHKPGKKPRLVLYMVSLISDLQQQQNRHKS